MDINFTDRELDIMAVLWERGPSTVTEVREALSDDLAYTTVLTVLRVLEEKGRVGHEEEGRAHRYFPRVKREEAGRVPTPTAPMVLGDRRVMPVSTTTAVPSIFRCARTAPASTRAPPTRSATPRGCPAVRRAAAAGPRGPRGAAAWSPRGRGRPCRSHRKARGPGATTARDRRRSAVRRRWFRSDPGREGAPRPALRRCRACRLPCHSPLFWLPGPRPRSS